MAELVGAISGGIAISTLAAQSLNCIIKLKSLWDEIQEAPSDVEDLLHEAELLTSLLLEIEKDNNDFTSSPLQPENADTQQRAKCMQYCRSALEKLRLLVNDLAGDIKICKGMRRKFLGAKLVLSRGDVKNYKSRLKGAVRLLTLSEQCSTRAYQRQIYMTLLQISSSNRPRQPNLLLYQEEHKSTPIPCQNSVEIYYGGSDEHESRSSAWLKYLFGSKRTSRYGSSIRYRTPGWLLNQVWEYGNSSSQNLWTSNLRIYNVVPQKSLIFDFAANNNVEAIKTLFRRKEASPFDRDELYGKTPLHIAAENGCFAVCQLLIQEGAEVNLPDFSENTPISGFLFSGGDLAFCQGIEVSAIMRLLLNQKIAVSSIMCSMRRGRTYHGPTNALSLLLNYMASHDPDELSPEDRVRMCISMAKGGWHNQPQLIRMVLCQGEIIKDLLCVEEKGGSTLMDNVMASLAESIDPFMIPNGDEIFLDAAYPTTETTWDKDQIINKITIQGWTDLLKELLIAGGGLHHLNKDDQTPFLTTWGIFNHRSLHVRGNLKILHGYTPATRMKIWLQQLNKAGVNLMKYGLAEQKIQKSGLCRKYTAWKWHADKCRWIHHARLYLIGFSYGPLPEDWQIWESEPTDIFAGQFWHMVEHPELRIPGAWIGANSDSEEEEEEY